MAREMLPTIRMWLLGTLGLVIGLMPTVADAQQSGKAKVCMVKKREFEFPLRLDRTVQPSIQVVHLFMREGPAPNSWILAKSVAPNARSIVCQVPRDGEFSFQVVTVDYSGRASADFRKLTPAITVLVNTGMMDSEAAARQAEERGQPSKVLQMGSPIYPTITAPAAATSMPEAPSRGDIKISAETPSFGVSQVGATGRMNNLANALPMGQADQTENPLEAAPPTVIPPNTVPTTSAAAQPTTPAPAAQAPMRQSAPAVSTPAGGPSNRQFFNSTRVGVDYNVGRVGPSGLAKIEVWATQDNGRSWQRVGEDNHRRNPIQVELPGEGVFGIRLVATNGNGFGGKAPAAGDSPTMTFEVDLTAPRIQSLDVDPNAKNGTLGIRWKIIEKNLTSEPISIFYASQRGGPWQLLASKVKNVDAFQWTLPKDVPNQLYFRIEVIDQAGNVGRFDSQAPVMVDQVVPDIDVIGVQAVPSSRSN